MKGTEVRKLFLEFFEQNKHKIEPSSCLVPENDPTILFANAGMNQFKNLFLGTEKRAYNRATTSQKCMRISGKHNDLENVGVTRRHHTFFEMLGNFSFGDYFKTDAIKFAWEFLTETLKLDKKRLWVTIFEEDNEAGELWKNNTDVLPGRILKLGEEENFWRMGPVGPCGPCTEIHYYQGDDIENQSEEEFRKDTGDYLEIWNLVFMQFDSQEDGTLIPLPKPSVDTGMGLERITAVLQDKLSNYDSDLLRPVITECERLSGFKYNGKDYTPRDFKADPEYARDVAMRVIADHSRSIAFLMADGVQPSSDGRGYVLRRIIRRAIRHAKKLNFKESFLKFTTKVVIENFSDVYPELKEKKDLIIKLVDSEENKFYETLDSGLVILNKEVETLKSSKGKIKLFPGDIAFQLHDTFGFPLDLTQDALKEFGLDVDVAAFEKAMNEQQSRSRADRESKGIRFSSVKIDAPKTVFKGYETTKGTGKLVQIVDQDEHIGLIFDQTVFYAESGGQVGDTGTIRFENAEFKVVDTQKIQNEYIVHVCKQISGNLDLIGKNAELVVDEERRLATAKNHTATHLLQSALQRTLGEHVKQAGSKVSHLGLRFDFAHYESITDKQMEEIQSFINQEVRNNYPVTTKVMALDDARKTGAKALFGEKYGAEVRVVEVGGNSIELCGGTHAKSSGELGLVLVGKDSAISSGVRRIECLTGTEALNQINRTLHQESEIAELLKVEPGKLAEKVNNLLREKKDLEKENSELKQKLGASKVEELLKGIQHSPNGIAYVCGILDGLDNQALRQMVDDLKVKLKSGVVILANKNGDTANVVAGTTKDLQLDSSSLIKNAVASFGAKGGGRADFAQAGGLKSSQANEVIDQITAQIL